MNIHCNILNIDKNGRLTKDKSSLETIDLKKDFLSLIKKDFTLIYGDNLSGKTLLYQKLLKTKYKSTFFLEDFNEIKFPIENNNIIGLFDLYINIFCKNNDNLTDQKIKEFCFSFFKIIDLNIDNIYETYYLFIDDLFDNFDKKNLLILIRMIKIILKDFNIKIKIIGFTHNINLGPLIFQDAFPCSKQSSVDFFRLSPNFLSNLELDILEDKIILKEQSNTKRHRIINEFIGGIYPNCKIGLPLEINEHNINDSREFITFLEEGNKKFPKKKILEWCLLLGISDVYKFTKSYGVE